MLHVKVTPTKNSRIPTVSPRQTEIGGFVKIAHRVTTPKVTGLGAVAVIKIDKVGRDLTCNFSKVGRN